MARLLDDEEITRQVQDLPDWHVDGNTLVGSFTAPAFLDGVALVVTVAQDAEQMNHHPDIDIRWRTVRFVLWTHDAGGLTQLDVELAHCISQAAQAAGVTPEPHDEPDPGANREHG